MINLRVYMTWPPDIQLWNVEIINFVFSVVDVNTLRAWHVHVISILVTLE
jgi:hypothetical protein